MSLSVTIDNVTDSSITASVSTSGSVAMEHYWYIDGTKDGIIQTDVGETSSTYTFSGLAPGTAYTVSVRVFAYNPWRELDNGSASATTNSVDPVAKVYYAKLILDGNGGQNGSSSTWTYTGWMSGWTGSADIEIAFDGSGFAKSGYSLLGFSESSSASSATYGIADTITITATSESESSPTTVRLYAIWSNKRPDNWEWESSVNKGSLFLMTAQEWNNFISRIQEFAQYCGVTLVSNYLSAAAATSGTPVLATQGLSAVRLLEQLPCTIAPSGTPIPGNYIEAAFFNGLRDSLNSIE